MSHILVSISITYMMIKLFKNGFDVNNRCVRRVVMEYIFSITKRIVFGSLMKIPLHACLYRHANLLDCAGIPFTRASCEHRVH